MHQMDAEYRPLIEVPRKILRDAADVRASITKSREIARSHVFHPDLQICDYAVTSSSHSKKIPIRIYRLQGSTGSVPVLLYLHGGGFFCGDLASDEAQCAEYAVQASCAVVCVAYRLAPEDPFPAALDDCRDVLAFLCAESKELRLNGNKIAVGGSSAGANLAAALTLMARDHNGPRICFQMLLVPALDDRLETSSATQFIDTPDFGRHEAETMWRWYLGEDPGDVSCYAAPARANDLTDLPPAYILCAGIDPLRDEGVGYAKRLMDANVAVEFHLIPSIPHGFASIPWAQLSRYLLQEQANVLRAAFLNEREA